MPSPDDIAAAQSQRAANCNTSGPTIKISFDELVAKSGLDEDALLQRIAEVLQRRSDDTVDKIVSVKAAE